MSGLLNPNVNLSSTLIWTGASGTKYEFHNYQVGSILAPLPGVYVFSRLHGELFYSIYVGETNDFSGRVSNDLSRHHRWPEICRYGATHISTYVILGGEAERLRIETDLRHGLNPPCNRQ